MVELRAPSPELAPWIEHYWFVTAERGPVDLVVTAFVDGRADLVFNHGAPYRRSRLDGEVQELSASNLDAQRTYPLRIEQRGLVWTSGVRFRRGGLAPFAAVPLRALTDRVVPLEEAFGASWAELNSRLARRAPDEAARLLDEHLGAACRPAGQERFREALGELEASRGQRAIEDLARGLSSGAGRSVRQVERDFARYLGLAPKAVARILRIQEALRRMMHEPDLKLAALAQEVGYYDQAHFIRDFRQMTGGVPRGYRGYYPPTAVSDFAPNLVVYGVV